MDGKQTLLLAFLISVAGWAHAELPALSLDQLLEVPVQAASKRAQKPAEAPSMVSIITADEIHRFGWPTLADALNSLPGIHASYDRSYATLGLRGFGRPGDYNSRLLMLIDGVPFNDGVYDQASVGTDFPIDLALIDRVEYVPGPGSSLYGGNAFFGVVNIVTLPGARHGKVLEASAGDTGSHGLRAGLGHRDEAGNDWLLSGSRSRRRGADLQFDSYAAPGADPWSRGLDYDHNDRWLVRYERGGFLAKLIANRREKGAPGGPYGVDLNDPRNANIEQSTLLHLNYEHFIDADRVVHLQAFGHHYDYEGHWVYDGQLSRDWLENRVVGGEARYTTRAHVTQTIVAGLSWRHDGKRRQANEYLDVDTPRRAVGLFVQDDWRLHDRFSLSLGLRYDRITTNGDYSRLSPRLALIGRLQPQTTVKLIAGSAFRPPNGFEADYAYAGTNLANPGLRPEYVNSLELGVQHAWSRQIQLAGSLYRNRIDNLIALETDPETGLQQHHNVGRIDAHGLELSARGEWAGIRLRGSVAWQTVRHENGSVLANTPRRQAKLLLGLPLPGGVQLGWEMHYLGSRRADSGEVDIEGIRVGGHLLAHATLSGDLDRRLAWQLRVANVFDRNYSTVVGTEFNANYPGLQVAPMPLMRQDGRGIYGSLRWSF